MDGARPKNNFHNTMRMPFPRKGTSHALAPQSLTYVFLPRHVAMTINHYILTLVDSTAVFQTIHGQGNVFG